MSVIQEIKSLSKVQVAFGTLVAGLTGLGGAYAGYIYAIKTVTEQIRMDADEALQKEIADAKEFYKKHNKQEEFSTPESAYLALHPEADSMDTAVEALKSYQGDKVQIAYDKAEPAPELREIVTNVFTDAPEPQAFDYEAEMARRDPDKPYLITLDEWSENETDFETVNYTYFEGDGILMNDDGDEIVTDVEGTVGADNLLRFGHGSGDDNVVFVRNHRVSLNYEISRSKGKYSVEVAGFPEADSLTHAYNHPALRRFRDN